MNDRLEEIKKDRAMRLHGNLVDEEAVEWLISALESARAEVERWKFDADTTREAHICTFKRAETAEADRDRWKARAERTDILLTRILVMQGITKELLIEINDVVKKKEEK